MGFFVEIIDEGALEGVLGKSDVLCVLNHDVRKGVLARCNREKGSLELSVDSQGLKYRFDAPSTALGDELLEGLRRGDISASSFSFTCGKDEWSKLPEGIYLRRILRFGSLIDVSPVYHPAYADTNVYIDKRGMDAMVEAEKTAPPATYFDGLRKKLRIEN